MSSGSFLDQKSTLFHAEFPQLGPGGAGDGAGLRQTSSYTSRGDDDDDDETRDMAGWRESGKPGAVSENPTTVECSEQRRRLMTNEDCCTGTPASAVSADDRQRQAAAAAYLMSYAPASSFHGHSLPPYMAMRPPVRPPAVRGSSAMGPPMPFHMMPPNYSPVMMTPFVRIFSLY